MGLLDTLTRDRKRMGLLSAGIGMLGARSLDEGMRRGYAGLLAGLQEADQTEANDYRQAMLEREMQMRELADQREAELMPIRDMKARAELANAMRGPELKNKAPYWAKVDESGNFVGVDEPAFEAHIKAQQADPMAQALTQLKMQNELLQQGYAAKDQQRRESQYAAEMTGIPPASRKKAVDDYIEKKTNFDKMQAAIDNFGRNLDEYGTQFSLGPVNSENAARLSSSYQTLLDQLRSPEMMNSGVFNPGEASLFEKHLSDPSNFMNFGKEKAIKGQLDEISGAIGRNRGTFRNNALPLIGEEAMNAIDPMQNNGPQTPGGAGEIKTLTDGRRYRIISYSPDGNHEIELLP